MEAGAAQPLPVSDELGQSVVCMQVPHGNFSTNWEFEADPWLELASFMG